MHQDFGFDGELLGKIEDTLYVPKTRGLRMVGNVCVREKAEEQFGAGSNRRDQFTTRGVVEVILVPDRNDMGPVLPLLERQFANSTDGEIDFHLVAGLTNAGISVVGFEQNVPDDHDCHD